MVTTLRIPGAGRWADSVRSARTRGVSGLTSGSACPRPPARCRPVVRGGTLPGGHRAGLELRPGMGGTRRRAGAAHPDTGRSTLGSHAGARAAAIRALVLDSSLAVAHTTLAQVRFLYDRDWPAADSAFRRAMAINPSRAEVHLGYARLLLAIGRVDEALMHARRALELDPLDPETIAYLGWHNLYTGRYAEVRESFDRALAADSSRAETRRLLGLLAEVMGDYELAESQYRAALDRAPDDPEALAALGRVHALGGRSGEARAVLARLDSLTADRYVSPYLFAASPRRSAIAAGRSPGWRKPWKTVPVTWCTSTATRASTGSATTGGSRGSGAASGCPRPRVTLRSRPHGRSCAPSSWRCSCIRSSAADTRACSPRSSWRARRQEWPRKLRSPRISSPSMSVSSRAGSPMQGGSARSSASAVESGEPGSPGAPSRAPSSSR